MPRSCSHCRCGMAALAAVAAMAAAAIHFRPFHGNGLHLIAISTTAAAAAAAAANGKRIENWKWQLETVESDGDIRYDFEPPRTTSKHQIEKQMRKRNRQTNESLFVSLFFSFFSVYLSCCCCWWCWISHASWLIGSLTMKVELAFRAWPLSWKSLMAALWGSIHLGKMRHLLQWY